jgi:ribosomal protein S19
MEDFKDLSSLQMFFDRMRTAERAVTIHPHHVAPLKGVIIHVGEDYVAIRVKRKQSVIPYNAIWRVDIEG